MADTAVLLEIITYIFQRTPPTADCDEPLTITFMGISYVTFCISDSTTLLDDEIPQRNAGEKTF